MRALAKNLKDKKQQESSKKNIELEQRIDSLLKRQQKDDESYNSNNGDSLPGGRVAGHHRLQADSDHTEYEPVLLTSTSDCGHLSNLSSTFDFEADMVQKLMLHQSTSPPPLGSHPTQKWRLDLQNLLDASASAKSEKQERGEVTPDTARRIQQLLNTSAQKPTPPPPQPPSKCIILVTTEFLVDGWDRDGNTSTKEEEFLKSLGDLLRKGKAVTETTVYIPYSVLNDIDALSKRSNAVINFLSQPNSCPLNPGALEEKHKIEQTLGDALNTVLKGTAPEHKGIILKRCTSLLRFLRRVLSLLRTMSNSYQDPSGNLLEHAALKNGGPSLCPYTGSDSSEEDEGQEMKVSDVSGPNICQWGRLANNQFRKPEVGTNLMARPQKSSIKAHPALRKAFVHHLRMNPYAIAGAPIRDQLYYSLLSEGCTKKDIISLRSTFGIPVDDKEAYVQLRSKKLHFQHLHEAEQAQAESERALLTAQDKSNGFSSILNFHINRSWMTTPSTTDATKYQVPLQQKQNKQDFLNDRSIKTLVSAVVAYRRTYYTNVIISGLLRVSENPNCTPSSVESKAFYTLPQRTSRMTNELNQYLFAKHLQGETDPTTKVPCFEWPMPTTEIAPTVFVLCGTSAHRPQGNFSTNFITNECVPNNMRPELVISNSTDSLKALWHSRSKNTAPQTNTITNDVHLMLPKNALGESGWVESLRENTSLQNKECELLTHPLHVDPLSLRNAAMRRVFGLFSSPPPQPKILFIHNLGTLEAAAATTQMADSMEFFYEPSYRSNISGCERFEWDAIVQRHCLGK